MYVAVADIVDEINTYTNTYIYDIANVRSSNYDIVVIKDVNIPIPICSFSYL